MFANYWIWKQTQPILGIEVKSLHLDIGVLAHEFRKPYITIELVIANKFHSAVCFKDIWCGVNINGFWYSGINTSTVGLASQARPQGLGDLERDKSLRILRGEIKHCWI